MSKKSTIIKVDGNEQLLRASLDTASYNEEERTIEVIAATDSDVLMRSWDGLFVEILSMNKKHIRTGRMAAGLSVLDQHNRWGSVKDTLGRTISYTIDSKNGQLRFVLKFSERESLAEFRQDVKDGIIKDISLGYNVYAYEEVTKANEDIPTRTAVDWEPTEVSFVQVPADYNAKARSSYLNGLERKEKDFYEVNIINKSKKDNMSKKPTPQKEGKRGEGDEPVEGTPTAPQAAAPATTEGDGQRSEPTPAAPAANPAPTADDATQAERKRVSQINELCRKQGISQEDAQSYIDNGDSLDSVRAAILDTIEKRQLNTNGSNAAGTDQERQMYVRNVVNAQLLRCGITTEGMKDTKVRKAADEYRYMTMIDLAEDCCQRAGINTRGMRKLEIATRASSHTTDFPVILGGIVNQTLTAEYTAVADTWRSFCSVGSLSDFRPMSRIRTGSLTNLESLKENGEFKVKALTDGDKELIQLQTKGNIINFSRQMIINDDLGAFVRHIRGLARAAARTVESAVYDLLAENGNKGPTMQDGNPLFDASHNNIATAAAMSIDSFQALELKMSEQMDKDGNDYLDITPHTLLAHRGKKATARLINEAQYDTASNVFQKPNVSLGMFEKIVTSQRLKDTDSYIAFANPTDEPVIEVAFLDGIETPFMEMQEGFNVDGIQWKVRHDFGVGAIGYQGAVLNEGA